MVDLAECYAPVVAEIAEFEGALDRELVSDSPAMKELVRHISRYAGKRLRPALVFLSAKACSGPGMNPEHIQLAVIIELIHTATLIHDDILDHADVRRRVPTVNALHGNHVSVLLGDYVHAHAFAMAVHLSTPAASRLLAKVIQVVCKGEIQQIFDRFDLDLSEERYVKIIEAKTAELYAAACELGATYGGASDAEVRALTSFGRNMGIAFQVIDDCLDLIGDESVVGKSLGTDLEGGKLTLPLIHLLRTAEDADAKRLRGLLQDPSRGNRRARLLEEFDLAASLDYSFKRADDYIRAAATALDGLPPTPARDALRTVADFVLCRKR